MSFAYDNRYKHVYYTMSCDSSNSIRVNPNESGRRTFVFSTPGVKNCSLYYHAYDGDVVLYGFSDFKLYK